MPLVIVLVSLAVPAAPALASLALAQKNACIACHSADRRMVGPSYQDIASKYAGQKDAAATLAASIRKGGAGKWGPVQMPAQPNLSEGDALALARWILDGGK